MLSRADRLLVEHVAAQQGFELPTSATGEPLSVASSLVPGVIMIDRGSAGQFVVATDLPLVASALQQEFVDAGAGSILAADENELYRLLGRAFQLCGALPDGPLQKFELVTSALPRTTEAERLVVQRIGQDIFRDALERYWDHRCPVTGVGDSALLRASHIKPWSESTDAERLDVYNGILLAAHLDAAFDKYLVTIDTSGGLLFSSRLSTQALDVLNPGRRSLTITLAPAHDQYLNWHRVHFQELELVA